MENLRKLQDKMSLDLTTVLNPIFTERFNYLKSFSDWFYRIESLKTEYIRGDLAVRFYIELSVDWPVLDLFGNGSFVLDVVNDVIEPQKEMWLPLDSVLIESLCFDIAHVDYVNEAWKENQMYVKYGKYLLQGSYSR